MSRRRTDSEVIAVLILIALGLAFMVWHDGIGDTILWLITLGIALVIVHFAARGIAWIIDQVRR